jgi:predicted phosphodiesterase
VKLDEMKNGIRCLNPGSVSIPKDGSHSCLIYDNGKFLFRILEE